MCWGVVLILFCGVSASVIASELQARTAREYDEYIGLTKDAFLLRAHRDGDVSGQPSWAPDVTPLTVVQLRRDGLRFTELPL